MIDAQRPRFPRRAPARTSCRPRLDHRSDSASAGCRRTSPGSARCSSASSPTSGPTSRCGRAPRTRSAASSRACARDAIPITLRGSGTGNYGQSVPLRGGVLLDLSGYNGFGWVRDGVGRAQAGIRLAEFDRQARPHGWELRWLPSTFRSATLGGLFGGGFGGVGSITYGPVAAPGNVLGARVMTVEPEPHVRRAARARGAAAAPHLRHERHRPRARGRARAAASRGPNASSPSTASTPGSASPRLGACAGHREEGSVLPRRADARADDAAGRVPAEGLARRDRCSSRRLPKARCSSSSRASAAR